MLYKLTHKFSILGHLVYVQEVLKIGVDLFYDGLTQLLMLLCVWALFIFLVVSEETTRLLK
jgi:hypothetical protein